MIENWKREKLKDVSRVFTDGDWIETKNQSSDGIRLVQTGNIGFGEFKNKIDKARYISETTFEQLKCTEIIPGDLLVSRLPDPVGKSCLIPELNTKMITGVDCTIIRTKEFLSPEFLRYFQMSTEYLKAVENRVSGSTRSRISRKNLGEIEIPLPPLPEQKRIVAILDEAFEAIDKAKANIERNLENAKELFQSKLNEVFSEKGEGWEEKSLGELTDKIGSGATPRGGQSSYKASGISLIRSMNVHDEGFRKKKLAFIDEEQASKLDNVTIQDGDVLLNITRASVARCCVVDSSFLPARVNQHVSIIRPSKGTLNSAFLHLTLTSPVNKNKLLGIGEQGATRQAITKAQIQSFRILFPSTIESQEEIISHIHNIRAKTNELVSQSSNKIDSLEELKKSLLQKAFSGELTEKEVVV